VNDPVRLWLDATLVGVALAGVIAFILLDRPRLHVALLLLIALLWGVELTVVTSNSAGAPQLFARLHPTITVATTLAAVAIVLSRRRRPRT